MVMMMMLSVTKVMIRTAIILDVQIRWTMRCTI